MLGVWIRGAGWYPTMDDVCDLLGCVFGIVGLVHQFPILPGFAMRDTVQVDSTGSELCQELR